MRKRKLIIDLDNAITIPVQDTDDAMALALALTSPEIELLGCTTCAGNCPTSQSTRNTLLTLEKAERTDIPVAQGNESPILRSRVDHFQYLDEKTAGLDQRFWKIVPDYPEPVQTASHIKAHEWIIQCVQAHPGEVTIVCLGSMTNLALALLTEPTIESGVKEVIHMGGAFVPNNDRDPVVDWKTPDIPDWAWEHTLRFNTLFDPEASAIVFRTQVPITLVPVNVTQLVYQRIDDMDAIRLSGTKFHHFLYDAGIPWVKWSVEVRKLPGAHMHDPLTLAIAVDRSFCRFETMHIDTEKLLSGGSPWLYKLNKKPLASVAVNVDVPRFESFLTRRLCSPVVKLYR